MKKMPFLAVVSLLVLLLLGISPAEAGKGKKKKKPLHGVVTAVENTAAPGKFTVRVQAKKKAAAAAAPADKTFTFSETTKFEKVVGKKDQRQTQAATFADLHKNDTLLITPGEGDQAESVKILAKKKSKKTV